MIPEVNITIVDGGLGLIPASVANTSVKVGICSRGIPNEISEFSNLTAAENALGGGPLVEALADTLAVAGGPVIAVPATPSTYGTCSSVTHEGSGTSTVTPSPGPELEIKLKVTTGGLRGTAQFAFSINGGEYGTPVLSAATMAVAGSLVTLAIASQTYTLGDVWTIKTTGVISLVGAGTVGWVTISSASPVDAYDIILEVLAGGALGTATFRYSVDGGNSYTPAIATPGAGIYALSGLGIYVTLAGTFVAGDTYAFTSTAASYSTSDATSALTALLADSREWGFVHIVGAPSSAANAATLAGVVDTSMTSAETQFRYVFAVVECPSDGITDATIIAAFESFASTRIMVCAGDVGHVSPVSGQILRRNCAWVVTSRIAKIRVGVDPAWVQLGRIPNVVSLYRNEAVTPGLDAARFTTMRTFIGFAGYYITNGNMMAPAGSDFGLVQYRRVMDRACQVVRAAEIPMLSMSVRIDPKTGYIDERDAQSFEARVGSQLKTALVATGDASAAAVVVDRQTNLLSSASQPVTVQIVPLAYFKEIDNTIGFANPALAA